MLFSKDSEECLGIQLGPISASPQGAGFKNRTWAAGVLPQ